MHQLFQDIYQYPWAFVGVVAALLALISGLGTAIPKIIASFRGYPKKITMDPKTGKAEVIDAEFCDPEP